MKNNSNLVLRSCRFILIFCLGVSIALPRETRARPLPNYDYKPYFESDATYFIVGMAVLTCGLVVAFTAVKSPSKVEVKPGKLPVEETRVALSKLKNPCIIENTGSRKPLYAMIRELRDTVMIIHTGIDSSVVPFRAVKSVTDLYVEAKRSRAVWVRGGVILLSTALAEVIVSNSSKGVLEGSSRELGLISGALLAGAAVYCFAHKAESERQAAHWQKLLAPKLSLSLTRRNACPDILTAKSFGSLSFEPLVRLAWRF